MEFLNEPVRIESLPRVESVALQSLEPAYRTVLRLECGITMAVLLIIFSAIIGFIPPLRELQWMALAAGVWLGTGGAWFFLMEKSLQNKGYAIRERDVIYRSGWIIQRTHTCPFNRIQHSTVTIGPLERRYGLASLVLYTAGSGEADMRIPGLKKETADTLKEWITKKVSDEPAEQL